MLPYEFANFPFGDLNDSTTVKFIWSTYNSSGIVFSLRFEMNFSTSSMALTSGNLSNSGL